MKILYPFWKWLCRQWRLDGYIRSTFAQVFILHLGTPVFNKAWDVQFFWQAIILLKVDPTLQPDHFGGVLPPLEIAGIMIYMPPAGRPSLSETWTWDLHHVQLPWCMLHKWRWDRHWWACTSVDSEEVKKVPHSPPAFESWALTIGFMVQRLANKLRPPVLRWYFFTGICYSAYHLCPWQSWSQAKSSEHLHQRADCSYAPPSILPWGLSNVEKEDIDQNYLGQGRGQGYCNL